MSELNNTLTSQLFVLIEEDNQLPRQVCEQAKAYAALDGCIVVVSDFRLGNCYIYAGAFGRQFGLMGTQASSLEETNAALNEKRVPHAALEDECVPTEIIDAGSAFEDCLFSKFHPDDEAARQLLELNYFRFMQTIPIAHRPQYNTSCIIRIQNTANQWRNVHYRVHYKAFHDNGSMWLAVCFYSPTAVQTTAQQSACIVNNQTGEVAMCAGQEAYLNLKITKREKEILRLIGEGLASKQIADRLCISEHTVNRHRQNIIERLGVSNTTQALHAAHLIGVI